MSYGNRHGYGIGATLPTTTTRTLSPRVLAAARRKGLTAGEAKIQKIIGEEGPNAPRARLALEQIPLFFSKSTSSVSTA